MTKVVDSSEYSTNAIFVGCSVNEDGEPLVEVNGKAIGTVAGLLDFLGKYQGHQEAKVTSSGRLARFLTVFLAQIGTRWRRRIGLLRFLWMFQMVRSRGSVSS